MISRRIMFYYIPVKIWSGVLPKKDILQRFGFQLVSDEGKNEERIERVMYMSYI